MNTEIDDKRFRSRQIRRSLAANICFHIDTEKFAAFTWGNSNWGIDMD
jgi:hypothetical protein